MNEVILNIQLIFAAMLQAQFLMNNKIEPDWELKPIDLPLAIISECVECARYAGFEWWNKNWQWSLFQCRLEYIDAIHFYYGILLKRYGRARAVSMFQESSGRDLLSPFSTTFTYRDQPVNTDAIIAATRKVILTASLIDNEVVYAKDDELVGLAKALRDLGSSLQMESSLVVSMYYAKNVLNGFRRANGYKEGTYVKVWTHDLETPLEDNEYLQGLVDRYISNNPGQAFSTLEQATEYLTPLLDAGYARHARGVAE